MDLHLSTVNISNVQKTVWPLGLDFNILKCTMKLQILITWGFEFHLKYLFYYNEVINVGKLYHDLNERKVI